MNTFSSLLKKPFLVFFNPQFRHMSEIARRQIKHLSCSICGPAFHGRENSLLKPLFQQAVRSSRSLSIGFHILWLAFLVLTACGERAELQASDDLRIDGPFKITDQWQVIWFEQPLLIDRKGYQLFELIVDEKKFSPNGDHDPDDMANHFNLRRVDGVLVKPEVILIGDNGKEVRVSAASNTWLDAGGISIGFGMYIDHYTPPPLYPADIRAFHSVRIRSNEAFTADSLRWWMDVRFPEGTAESTGKPATP